MKEKFRTIDYILDDANIKASIKAVRKNDGAPGIDEMSVDELDGYFALHQREMNRVIRDKKYKPKPVKRVYIDKPNSDEKRPLGIPCCTDRVYQTAVSRVLEKIFEPSFSEHSHGFRHNRSCHTAMKEALGYLNEGCEWVIDFDIRKFFDTVNHDKLISIIREKMNDDVTLHLIRGFLKSGIMDDGLSCPTELGVPQGSPLSPLLSNIYLDKLDKELEYRGLRFTRYADDFNIYVKSEAAANRVMKSVTSWIERKLYLQVSAVKTKVVRPSKSEFLGFGFWKDKSEWKCKPLKSRQMRLYDKIRKITCRRKACARPLSDTVEKINEVVRGWINYYKIGSMKDFLKKFGAWLRHKVRVIMFKQWKRPLKIFKSLKWYCRLFRLTSFSDEDIFKVANSRKGLYAQTNGNVVNFILSPTVLGTRLESKKNGPLYKGLINPLAYYNNDKCDSVLYLS